MTGRFPLTPAPVRCGCSAVPPAGPGSRSGRWRRWCLRPDGCRRHGRGPVRRRSQGQARCRRAGPRSGTPRTDGRGPCAGTPGPVSETSMIATAPSRRPVMRICWVAASLFGRPSSACAALRTRLSSTRNSWSGSASIVSPRSIALIQAIDASDGKACGFAHLGHDRLDQDHAAVGRGFLGAAIGQRRLAERDGALQRAHQFRRKALHPRIGHAGQLVRQQLRGGQQVAQIVVDLRHREAERGEPALLMQHRHQVALHVGQFALGDADLVAALARHDDPRRAFRIFVEADQAWRSAAASAARTGNAARDRPAPRSGSRSPARPAAGCAKTGTSPGATAPRRPPPR